MFGFPKLTRRRRGAEKRQQQALSNSSYEFSFLVPASSTAPYSHHHHDGSTVSLPAGIFGPGAGSTSSFHTDLPPGALTRPPTRLDDDHELFAATDSARHLQARARALFEHRRPSTFHELDPMFHARLRQNLGHPAESEPGVSPVALPQKALALLGLEERGVGFGRPASPMMVGGGIGDTDSIYSEDDSRSFSNRDSDVFSECTQKTYMGNTRVSRQTFKFTPLAPPPERLYFRPQSLCSSFSTTSDHTDATEITTITVMTPTSQRICDSPELDPEDNSTLTSDSTIPGTVPVITMLNLDSDTDSDDGSDDEQAVSPKTRIRSCPLAPYPSCRPGELPLEVSLQICSYFSPEFHTVDLPPESQSCPNCNLRTLHALTLTSRAWSAAATKILYRVIALDFGTYDPASKTLLPFTTCTHSGNNTPLHTNIDVEARLPLLYRTIWDSPYTLPQRIEGIKIPHGMFSITKYPLSAILQKCPNLRFIDGAVTSGSTKDLLAILEPLKNIERWSWGKIAANPTTTSPRIPLPGRPPSPALSSSTISSLHTRSSSASLLSSSSVSSSPSFNISIIPRLLRSWPNLRTLEIESIDFPLSSALIFPPSLRNLSLRNLTSPDIPHLFNNLPPLTSLTIIACTTADRLHRYLSRHGFTLRNLHLEDVAITVEHIMPFLPRLQTLVVKGKGVKMGRMGEGEGGELRSVDVATEEGLRECVGWLVEVSRREGMGRIGVRRGEGDDAGEWGRLQMECLFNGVELVEISGEV